MKKILLALIAVATLFTACEKFNDQFDGLDETIHPPYIAELAVTLTDDDYTTIKTEALKVAVTQEEIDIANSIGNYKNFSSDSNPFEYIPFFLAVEYPAFDKGAYCEVTYNFYAGAPYYPKGEYDYNTLANADYDAMGTGTDEPGQYNNFSSSVLPKDWLPAWLLTEYPAAVADEDYLIVYKYYDSGTTYTFADYYKFDGVTWSSSNGGYYWLSSGEYDDMGEGLNKPGQYNNFSSSVDPDYYLPLWLKSTFPSAKSGDVQKIGYLYYSGSALGKMVEYTFVDSDWIKTPSLVVNKALFGFNGDVWAYVPPIKFIESTKTPATDYTLTDADYELVGNGYYKNFDTRAGKAEELIEVRIEKISTILKYNFEIEVGDVYSVTYNVYDGTNHTETTVVEAVEDL